MSNEVIFIDINKLPEPLSKKEVYELLFKIAEGDRLSIEKLAEHNIKLVISRVTGRFRTVKCDKKELVSIGNIGLMKAIITFDVSKNVEFSSYAARCIDNEILRFLRSLKHSIKFDSLDRPINIDKDGKELMLMDMLCDDNDMVEEYIDDELHLNVRQIVNNLPDREREITKLYFGFYDNKTYTLQEIANIFKISRTSITKLLISVIKQVSNQLKKEGLIEVKTKETKMRLRNR